MHGVDCSTKWPDFEEYSGELRHFSGSGSKQRQKHRQQQQERGVVLTRKVTKDDDEHPFPSSSSLMSSTGKNGNGRFKSYLTEGIEEGWRRESCERRNDEVEDAGGAHHYNQKGNHRSAGKYDNKGKMDGNCTGDDLQARKVCFF